MSGKERIYVRPQADPLTLGSLIAWLETKDPRQQYDWNDRCGRCLFGQYMKAHGIPWNYDGYDSTYGNVARTFGNHIALAKPWNFGAALERARAQQ